MTQAVCVRRAPMELVSFVKIDYIPDQGHNVALMISMKPFVVCARCTKAN